MAAHPLNSASGRASALWPHLVESTQERGHTAACRASGSADDRTLPTSLLSNASWWSAMGNWGAAVGGLDHCALWHQWL